MRKEEPAAVITAEKTPDAFSACEKKDATCIPAYGIINIPPPF
jgi:hypothetical protein